LQAELIRLARYPLLVVDEVGYIPFEPEVANLFFQLVSSRYERASLIVTFNKALGRWGAAFGDEVVAAAMIDRRPPRRSRRPQRRLLPIEEPRPRPGPHRTRRYRMNPELVNFHLPTTDQFSVAVDIGVCGRDPVPEA
jgi:IstB-like ATP binding protein